MADASTPAVEFIRIAEAKRLYFGGQMSLRWWYKQVETGALPHFRAGGAVLLRPADVEAFVAAMYCERKGEPETVPSPQLKPKSDRCGLRFF